MIPLLYSVCVSRIGWADMATSPLLTPVRVTCTPKRGSSRRSESCRGSEGSRKQGCSVLSSSHTHTPGESRGASPFVIWASCLADSETIRLMSARRCSLPDIIGSEDRLRRKRRRRRKRYALSGLKWHKTDLTWRCVSCHTLVVLAQTHEL